MNQSKDMLYFLESCHTEARGIPNSLIAVLDSIREEYRNPTIHPEKTYGEDEVQSLLTHCADVLNRITRI